MSIANIQVELWRANASVSASGATTRNYYRYAMRVPCQLEQKSGAQSLIGGQERAVQAGEAFFSKYIGATRSILEDDQIRWENRRLRILSVDEIHSNPAFAEMVRVIWTEADNAE
jgi:hypothetical protein